MYCFTEFVFASDRAIHLTGSGGDSSGGSLPGVQAPLASRAKGLWQAAQQTRQKNVEDLVSDRQIGKTWTKLKLEESKYRKRSNNPGGGGYSISDPLEGVC